MKPGMGWPIGVGVILGATVISNFAVMRIASSDPSFAVEPDYYARAVAFDSTMAARQRSLDLGWGLEASVDSLVPGETPHLTVRLKASDASPLVGAHVSVVARFNARANDTLTAVLREDAPGMYVAPLAIHTPGLWEFRVDASRPDPLREGHLDQYEVSTRVQVK